jgi:hypothetical protein
MMIAAFRIFAPYLSRIIALACFDGGERRWSDFIGQWARLQGSSLGKRQAAVSAIANSRTEFDKDAKYSKIEEGYEM